MPPTGRSPPPRFGSARLGCAEPASHRRRRSRSRRRSRGPDQGGVDARGHPRPDPPPAAAAGVAEPEAGSRGPRGRRSAGGNRPAPWGSSPARERADAADEGGGIGENLPRSSIRARTTRRHPARPGLAPTAKSSASPTSRVRTAVGGEPGAGGQGRRHGLPHRSRRTHGAAGRHLGLRRQPSFGWRSPEIRRPSLPPRSAPGSPTWRVGRRRPRRRGPPTGRRGRRESMTTRAAAPTTMSSAPSTQDSAEQTWLARDLTAASVLHRWSRRLDRASPARRPAGSPRPPHQASRMRSFAARRHAGQRDVCGSAARCSASASACVSLGSTTMPLTPS